MRIFTGFPFVDNLDSNMLISKLPLKILKVFFTSHHFFVLFLICLL